MLELDPRRQLKELKQQREEVRSELATLKLPSFNASDDAFSPSGSTLHKWHRLERKLEGIDTDIYLTTAQCLAIEIPVNKPDWWKTAPNYARPSEKRDYLTTIGKIGMSVLIRKAKRENIEWWVKIIGGILAGLTGLAGTIIGIIAILSK